jgi:hypothetical protein
LADGSDVSRVADRQAINPRRDLCSGPSIPQPLEPAPEFVGLTNFSHTISVAYTLQIFKAPVTRLGIQVNGCPLWGANTDPESIRRVYSIDKSPARRSCWNDGGGGAGVAVADFSHWRDFQAKGAVVRTPAGSNRLQLARSSHFPRSVDCIIGTNVAPPKPRR